FMFADQQIGRSPDIAVGYHSRNPNSILSKSKRASERQITRAEEKIVRKPVMPGMLVVMASAIMLLISPAWAQSNPAEQEVLQIRQKMARSFAEAVNNRDGMHAADQYSKDVVFSLLVPPKQ